MQYWDPLRKKNVAATPEEKVRQWFIGLLNEQLKVPMHMMMSEVAFRFGEKSYRADIVIYDRDAKALAVVECKNPTVNISTLTAQQALRYNSVLGVKFIFLTNGNLTYLYFLKDGIFTPCETIPSYEQMLCQE